MRKKIVSLWAWINIRRRKGRGRMNEWINVWMIINNRKKRNMTVNEWMVMLSILIIMKKDELTN